jgi:hypothetical protein
MSGLLPSFTSPITDTYSILQDKVFPCIKDV